MCNGVDRPKTLCIDESAYRCKESIDVNCNSRYDFPFSGLLRFDRDDASNGRSKESMVCGNGTVWDIYHVRHGYNELHLFFQILNIYYIQ